MISCYKPPAHHEAYHPYLDVRMIPWDADSGCSAFDWECYHLSQFLTAEINSKIK